jgi:site-specific recombinase
VVTRRLLNYINRTKKLVELKYDINSEEKWNQLILEYIDYDKTKNSLRKYYSEHADLYTLEIVEHTAQKGEKYLAENHQEYISFLKKGLLGGAFISVFALFKIIMANYVSSPIPQAFLFSINYALCFVIVYFFGGIIATKQPAMTASTIAKHIDKNDELHCSAFDEIIVLMRKIIRSQFISLVGNFLMAFTLSCFLAYLLTLGFLPNPIYPEKSTYLIQQVFPFSGGAIFYAAIAGVFLSFSGFISGYFDNKVKASNLAYRIVHNNFISKVFSKQKTKNISLFVENSLGVHAGNISLGFFLGCAFLLSYIFQFNIDIRHIAFSSSNLGYSLMNNTYGLSTIALAIVSVFIIGFVNFIVSFSITFLLVLKSRGIKSKKLRKLFFMSFKDFIINPLDYLVTRKSK